MSIPVRLFLFVTLPIAVSLIALGAWIQGEMERQFERRMQEEVQMVARALQAPLGHALRRDRPGSVESGLEAVKRISRVYSADIYDADGELIASTRDDPAGEAPPTVVVPTTDEVGQSSYERVEGRNVYSYFVPLTATGGRILGFLKVTRLESEISAFISRLRRTALVMLGGVIFLVSLIVVLGYQGAVGRAVDSLRRTITRVRDGDRSVRSPVLGPRELAGLSEAFNRMLDAIESAEEEIEERRAREGELQKELRRSEQLAALGRLSGGIAHELGSPLTTVRGHAQRALRHTDLPDEVCRSLEQISSEAQRMELITTELLQFGRTGGGRRVAVPVGLAVGTAVKRVEEWHDVDVELIETPANAAKIEIEMARFERALVNVLENAVYAGERVAVRCELSDGVTLIHVDDDGPGIPDDVRARVFEPFFTTKPMNAGTGLGLSIVHTVVTEHDGAVRVGSSDTLGGARVTLAFPTIDVEDAPTGTEET